MPHLILPERWKRQPTQRFKVDWNHPLSRRLVAAYIPTFPVELVRGIPVAPDGTIIVTTRGPGLAVGTSTNASGPGMIPEGARGFYQPLDEISLHSYCYETSETNFSPSICRPNGTGSGQNTYAVGLHGGSNDGCYGTLRTTAGQLTISPVAPEFDVLVPRSVTLSSTMADMRVWADEFAERTTARSNNQLSYTATAGASFCPHLGGYKKSAGTPGVPQTFLTLMWDRAIAYDEHRLLFENPWQLFHRDPARLYFYPVAGGGGTAYDASISESVTATDSVSASLTTSPAIAEAVAALDAVSAALMGVAALAETAVAADSVSGAAIRPATVAESAAATDSVSAGAAGYSVGISEAVNATDAVSGVLAAVGALAEAVAATDVVSSLAALAAQLAEAVTVQDTVSATGASYSVSVAEAIAATDAVNAQLASIAAVLEAANATDAYASLATLTAAVTEAVAALDQVSARGVLGVTVTESVAVTDVVSAAGALGDAPPARTIRVEMSDRVITVQSDGRTIRVSSAPRTIH